MPQHPQRRETVTLVAFSDADFAVIRDTIAKHQWPPGKSPAAVLPRRMRPSEYWREPIRGLRTVHSVKVSSEDLADWASALAGEGEAFGRIFDRHRSRVLRHSRRLVTHQADVDDVVAVTFLEAWRNRARVRLVDDSVLPWLLVTATNVANNTNRSARRHRALLARLPASDPVADPTDLDSTEAMDALTRLSLPDRRVVVLCILEGFSERDAADALGVPPGTVKSRLSRAKQRLRSQLSGISPQATLVEEAGQ